MNKPENLTGRVFGLLTVVGDGSVKVYPGGQTKLAWLCNCECGGRTEVVGQSLRNGGTRSCGCKRVGQRKENRAKDHPLHPTWSGLKGRCFNEKNKSFPRYGGRGIMVCERWVKSFWAFVSDMGDRPSPNHSIERKDNNGNYTPENCIWATKSEQANNRATSAIIEVRSVTKTVAEWAAIHNIDYHIIYKRVFLRGWDPEKAMTTPAGLKPIGGQS